jgi:hypothetical protein
MTPIDVSVLIEQFDPIFDDLFDKNELGFGTRFNFSDHCAELPPQGCSKGFE